MNRGDIKLCIDRCIAHDVPDCADMIENLAEQLAASQKREVMLREALEYSIKQVPELATVPGIATALAATEADLDGLILCEAEPVAWKNPDLYPQIVNHQRRSTDAPLYRPRRLGGQRIHY